MTTVLLSSGGLDSALLAGMNPDAVHLAVDYGQRHVIELDAARAVARHYGAAWHLARCDLRAFGGSTLTDVDAGWSGAATVVPNRNAVLLSLAVALAQSMHGGTVLIGCNADDREHYPDCRAEFIHAADVMAAFATAGRVRVEAPLLRMDKPAIGAMARRLDVPIDLTWSCYAGDSVPCRTCGACEQRERALGVHDHQAL